MRYCLLLIVLALQTGCIIIEDPALHESVPPCQPGVMIQPTPTGEPPLMSGSTPRIVTTAEPPR